jgi:hypothetical protein
MLAGKDWKDFQSCLSTYISARHYEKNRALTGAWGKALRKVFFKRFSTVIFVSDSFSQDGGSELLTFTSHINTVVSYLEFKIIAKILRILKTLIKTSGTKKK